MAGNVLNLWYLFGLAKPAPPPGMRWHDDKKLDFLIVQQPRTANDAASSFWPHPSKNYQKGDHVDPKTGKVTAQAAQTAASSDTAVTDDGCPFGTEKHADGNCYPIECQKGFSFDPTLGFCVESDEPPPDKGGGNADLKAKLKALKKQIAQLNKSNKAADRQHAAELEREHNRIEQFERERERMASLQRRQARQPNAPTTPTSDLLSTAKDVAPYAAGAAVVAGGLYYLWTR